MAVVGPAGDPATRAMHLVALRGTAPGAAVVVGDPDAAAGEDAVPLLADRPLVDGRPTAYVCRHFVCSTRPPTEPSILAVRRCGAALGARSGDVSPR